ncbi:MAG: EF-hand domain-containing protein [Bacteroidota bacterium]
MINPFEAFDALMVLQKEHGNELSIHDISTMAAEMKEEEEAELKEMFEEFDVNQDGKVEIQELSDDMSDFAEMMDTDTDGLVSLDEMTSFDVEDALLASEEEIHERIANLFLEHKATNEIELKNIAEEKRGRYEEWDADRNGKVSKEEAYEFMMADNTPIQFSVSGKTAFMKGVITAALPTKVLQLFFDHPEVDTIEMITVPGSIDDEANLRAALYVNKMGLTTKLNARSVVASGGTDFFLCGKKRIVEVGAKLGVHSWGGGAVPAIEVPKDDPVHEKYLDFYKKVGVPIEFYWYTLEAAPAEEIHMMTPAEMEIYKVRK